MSRTLAPVLLGGHRYMEATDMRRPGRWMLDGQGPIPAPLAARLTQNGEPWRLATFGKVLRAGAHDFGPGVGVQPVVVCEKWAGVLLPYPPPNDVQGVLLPQVPHL